MFGNPLNSGESLINNPQNSGGSLFNNPQNSGGGLFGGLPTTNSSRDLMRAQIQNSGGGLFGTSPQNSARQNTSGNLFGSGPANNNNEAYQIDLADDRMAEENLNDLDRNIVGPDGELAMDDYNRVERRMQFQNVGNTNEYLEKNYIQLSNPKISINKFYIDFVEHIFNKSSNKGF